MHIRTSGTRIHVRDQGEGELALVFLHYWGGSSRTWDGVVAELSSQYRTIATDHRGWGDSDAPVHGYTIADLANDAQDVIEALSLRRYVVVGHSMGGKTAQLLATRRPNGLEGVVLVAPSPPSPMVLPDEQRAAMAKAYDSRESIEWVLDNVLTANALEPHYREQVVIDSLRGAPQAKGAWPNAAMLEDITGDVGSINVPVMVIAGELDQVDRVETLHKELLPRIASARLCVLPDTGHLSPLEAPSALATTIRQFVGELESARSLVSPTRRATMGYGSSISNPLGISQAPDVATQ
ncbi:alpha/beta fold hydrolase [Pararobbsia alpina]|uniref:Arylesterase n=1 Tax=Pararobbsia alpina TaxID=621374 RepID=A0A6S7B5T4_9BURK|nr:alpha/beta hydrolase [Pararobbsia alpina]CAB3788252.1 Arylesterase [Pararobbsia alpina]